MTDDLHIREACSGDFEAIAAILNVYIATSPCVFRETPADAAFIAAKHHAATARNYPFLVAERAGEVLGYAALAAFRGGECDRLAESSVYLSPAAQGMGIGDRLYGELLARAAALAASGGLTGIMAAVTASNAGSIRFHRRHGFFPAGVWRDAGFKFGTLHDVALLQWLPPPKPPA